MDYRHLGQIHTQKHNPAIYKNATLSFQTWLKLNRNLPIVMHVIVSVINLSQVLSYNRNVIYPTSNPPSTGISPSALGSSFPTPAMLQIARLQYLLLWISFVLITRMNDWFGYLNASFRGTWLPCHGYELQAGLCFTWGSLSSFTLFRYTHKRCIDSLENHKIFGDIKKFAQNWLRFYLIHWLWINQIVIDFRLLLINQHNYSVSTGISTLYFLMWNVTAVL